MLVVLLCYKQRDDLPALKVKQAMTTPWRNNPLDGLLLRCPHCNRPLFTALERCPSCQKPLHLPGAATTLLQRPAVNWPHERHGVTRLLPGWRVVLQVLPSGACLTLPDESRVLLGRGAAPPDEHFLDLDTYNGYKRGVSRRHCFLLREDDHLYIVDLGSSNGSSLNGEPLTSHRRYSLANGDKLILGSMHFGISFFKPDPPPSKPSS